MIVLDKATRKLLYVNLLNTGKYFKYTPPDGKFESKSKVSTCTAKIIFCDGLLFNKYGINKNKIDAKATLNLTIFRAGILSTKKI